MNRLQASCAAAGRGGAPMAGTARTRGAVLALIGLLMAAGPAACGQPREARHRPVILATTTSTYDSGLLDALIPPFEARSGRQVKTIAVGSGKALALGERGEADIVLVHAPEAEERYMSRGAGLLRRRMMYNDFVLVGPPADPAGTRGAPTAAEALARIAASGTPFVSRGDDSGTHQLERKLWTLAPTGAPRGEAYLETGQGMGATLRVASEKAAYTLSDRGTFLSQRTHLQLEVLFEGDPVLRNVYHVIVVNPEQGPRVNREGGEELARYLLSKEALDRVRTFGAASFGQPLFVPDAEPYEQ